MRVEDLLFMKQPLAIFALLTVITGARAATDGSESDNLSPAERYRELLREYNRTSSAVRTVTTDEGRRSVADAIRAFALRFVALADSDPRDPIALTALRQAVQAVVSGDSAAERAWEMNRTAFPRASSDDSERRIVALLRRFKVIKDIRMARVGNKIGDIGTCGHLTGMGGGRVEHDHDRTGPELRHDLSSDRSEQPIGHGPRLCDTPAIGRRCAAPTQAGMVTW